MWCMWSHQLFKYITKNTIKYQILKWTWAERDTRDVNIYWKHVMVKSDQVHHLIVKTNSGVMVNAFIQHFSWTAPSLRRKHMLRICNFAAPWLCNGKSGKAKDRRISKQELILSPWKLYMEASTINFSLMNSEGSQWLGENSAHALVLPLLQF